MLLGTCAPEGLTPAERRYSCAAESEGREERLLGTASPTRSYLLVEEPGPWGPGSVPRSRLGEPTTAALRDLAGTLGAKLLLVRRPGTGAGRAGGASAVSAERTLARVSCARGRERVVVRTAPLEHLVEAASSSSGWSDLDVSDGGPLLVCTHGRKDWCCARRGRPLASALSRLAPGRVWECSHLGGDRFAANLLSLPTGWTWGRVEAEAHAADVVAATAARRVVPELLRGRACDAMVVQAADVHARLALGRTGVDDLVPRTARRVVEDDPGTAWVVTFDDAVAGGAVEVEVASGHVSAPQRLTCSAAAEQHARTWELVALRPQPPGGQEGT